MIHNTESLIAEMKNKAMITADDFNRVIAALEQSEKLKETFRIQSNMFCADANELKARVEDLDSQRKWLSWLVIVGLINLMRQKNA